MKKYKNANGHERNILFRKKAIEKFFLKSLVVILIAGLMFAAFSGCHRGEEEEEILTTEEQTAAVVVKDNTTVMQGVILVGIDIDKSPYIYKNEDGRVEGFEIDFANAIGELTLSDIKYVELDRTIGYAELDKNSYDCIISAVAYDEDVDKVYDFSAPYYTDEAGTQYCILVKTGNNRLLNVLNQSIGIMKEQGKLEEIVEKWFNNEEE